MRRRARDAGGSGARDCTACGACCFADGPRYLRVFGVDLDRMDARARALTRPDGDGCYLELRDDRCAALARDAGRGRLLCSIYEMRPDCCRALVPDSGECLRQIAEKAVRARAAIGLASL
ncbi:MAG: YkgJ family cysteine cluster protein [Deltaproteobacteria bacterium]|nr:YkgJ family cysteine cluster protein [Deltaproteobacteria bacterium]